MNPLGSGERNRAWAVLIKSFAGIKQRVLFNTNIRLTNYYKTNKINTKRENMV